MRLRPARVALSALAWIALGGAAFFAFTLQQQTLHRRTTLHAFETAARDAVDALGDAQGGQQAYVAPGQETREWIPKVAAYLQTASNSLDSLRTATHGPATSALTDASASLAQIKTLDARVRARLANDGAPAASEVIFSEASDAFSTTVTSISTALDAERQAADQFEIRQQRLQVAALGGAGIFAAFAVALLMIAPGPRTTETTAEESFEPFGDHLSLSFDRTMTTPAPEAPQPSALAAAEPPVPTGMDTLKLVADLCTEFGRVRDATELKALLERAADAMNARGIIVWLGSGAGADLRPVLAHGYSESTLARIPSVARSADNAAAAAYRTGTVQIVKSRPGASQGAIVAPLLAADGCIGALTAEIRDRGEDSEPTRALALIFAAQLAGILSTAADTHAAGASQANA